MYAEKIKRNQNLLESNEYANGAPLKRKPSDMESFRDSQLLLIQFQILVLSHHFKIASLLILRIVVKKVASNYYGLLMLSNFTICNYGLSL